MNKFILRCTITSILVLSLGLSGCAKKVTVEEDCPLVRTQTVTLGNGASNATYAGEVKGRYEAQLAFQVSGKIIRRNVEIGSEVQPGDVLMEIDAKDIRQSVNMSSAQVASAESQLHLAEANLARYRTLFSQGAVSKAQLDQYQNAYEVARAAVNQAAAQNTQGVNQLGYSDLIADSAGVIAAINAEAGQVVSTGQPVVTLVKDGEREIEISVPESRVGEMRQVQQLLVSFWALPGVVTEGKVREISPVPDKISRTYKVRIALPETPKEVNLGMTASVTISNAGEPAAVVVPLAAIYQTGDQPNVWVVKEGTVRVRPVKVGGFRDGGVTVLEGLQGGDVIVTAGVQKLREGQKVRI